VCPDQPGASSTAICRARTKREFPTYQPISAVSSTISWGECLCERLEDGILDRPVSCGLIDEAQGGTLPRLECRRRVPGRQGVDLGCGYAAPERNRPMHRLFVGRIVDLSDAQNKQFLEVAWQRGILAQRVCIARLGTQHLRRQSDDAVNVEQPSAALPDALEHIGEDRVVERLRNIAEPGHGARPIGGIIAGFLTGIP
jgi:hypothetical protein